MSEGKFESGAVTPTTGVRVHSDSGHDELIARLRARAGSAYFLIDRRVFAEAADALEAAQREVAELRTEADVWRHFAAEARSEAAAERALADQLADALSRVPKTPSTTGTGTLRIIGAALAAHRERRTTPTKDGDQ